MVLHLVLRRSRDLQVDQFGAEGCAFEVEDGESDRKGEAAGTAAAGVQVEDFVFPGD